MSNFEELKTTLEAKRKALTAEIEQVEKDQKAARDAARAAVKRDWRFTIHVSTAVTGFDRIRTGSGVRLYCLSGSVLNKKELLAAGHNEDHVKGGSMRYLFNVATGKFICSSGGGNIYIADGSFFHLEKAEEAREDAEAVYNSLERFLANNPEGGDVTAIILSQRHLSWKD
jgi:hypothetical protein